MVRPILAFLAALLAATPLAAQNEKPPFWASLDSEKINLRVGPSRDYRIEWVYHREGLPVRVLRVAGGWWFVAERDGTKGWVTAALLSRTRTAVVTEGEPAAIRGGPGTGELRWRAEPGVIGRLGRCEAGWCEIDITGRIGWMRADRLWGDGAA